MSAQPKVRYPYFVKIKPGVGQDKFSLAKELDIDRSQIIEEKTASSNQFRGNFTSTEAEKLRKNAKVLSVCLTSYRHLQQSGYFLQLPCPTNQRGRLLVESDSGSDVIIRDIDSGISPEYLSFSDLNMGPTPIPRPLKGECQNETGVSPSNCNKKRSGARSIPQGDATKQAVPSNSIDYCGPMTRARARAKAKQIKETLNGSVQVVPSNSSDLLQSSSKRIKRARAK